MLIREDRCGKEGTDCIGIRGTVCVCVSAGEERERGKYQDHDNYYIYYTMPNMYSYFLYTYNIAWVFQ